MAAYVIVQVDIFDNKVYDEYKKLSGESVKAYGGKFVLRGNPVEVLEGEWDHDRLVMLEFPDKESARNWYYSKEYQKAKEIRSSGSAAKFILIEG
ncbi:MAG: DUF1330 domain-containing protein [Algoriphagus sp.]|uniref:DUF1330 domain-containing protein n=1 Tax=Algoriphagus sp. TaxID=1872435 RepID=UPI0017AA7BF3|nr:DUF1330 domain-containing protein [Algoriphagus sp.]NVJ86177.1 DUF1330 domain-containing protein [Algoriphagus sp.]